MTIRQDLTAANSRIGNTLIQGAGRVAREAFLGLGSWRDADVDRYIRQIAPSLTGIKLQAARSTVAFYKSMADLTGQDFTRPVFTASDLATKALRNGAGTDLVYRRPFVDMRTALSRGSSFTDALEAGARRAQSLAQTEVQLARRDVGLKARNSNDRIVGYIRTLTGQENCALCFVASTQRYTRGELMPIHPGCDCGEMPIYGTQDPGQVINEVRLEAVHENIETRFGVSDRGARELDYRAITITEHGEMGPMLTVRGQSTQAAGDVGEQFGVSRVMGELSKDEQNALKSYGRQEYKYINAGLRDGFDLEANETLQGFEDFDLELWQNNTSLIDEAMEKSAIAEEIKVYRGTANTELAQLTDEQMIGLTVRDKAFTSTTKGSFEEFTSYGFASEQNLWYEITVPKGARGLDMNEIGVSFFEEEKEVLLPRNSTFKITGVVEKEYQFRNQTLTHKVIQMEVVQNA